MENWMQARKTKRASSSNTWPGNIRNSGTSGCSKARFLWDGMWVKSQRACFMQECLWHEVLFLAKLGRRRRQKAERNASKFCSCGRCGIRSHQFENGNSQAFRTSIFAISLFSSKTKKQKRGNWTYCNRETVRVPEFVLGPGPPVVVPEEHDGGRHDEREDDDRADDRDYHSFRRY